MQSEQFFPGEAVYYYQINWENKDDLKRQCEGIVIRRFGRRCALICFRCNSIEVDLNNLRQATKISDEVGCGGTLHLHLAQTKSHIRYLVDSRTLVSLTRIRSDILQNSKATWSNTITRLGPDVFLKGELNQSELGGGALKTFLGFTDVSSGLSGLNKGDTQKIQELKGLIGRQPIDRKRGTGEDEILK